MVDITNNIESVVISEYENTQNKIQQKTAKIAIMGLGYVGLPLLCVISKKEYYVIGYDVDITKISNLSRGKSVVDGIPDKTILNIIESQKYEFTADEQSLSQADIIIICVPTPLTKNREPDVSYIQSAVYKISKIVRYGQLIVLESTTYPGTTKDLLYSVFKEKGFDIGKDLFIAYSPEREDPGNLEFDTSSTPKIVGADDNKSLTIALNFYNNVIVKTVAVHSTMAAEAVKITENIFRLVNISLINELKIIYEKMGIDIWEIIDAAKTKPFGYMPFYPGPGIGGHCIPIDPFYLTWKAKEFNCQTKFIELSGEIMSYMPGYVISRLRDELDKRFTKSIKNSRILILGVTYKANVADIRESPALKIMHQLINSEALVDYYDPYIPHLTNAHEFLNLRTKTSIQNLPETYQKYDAVIICTKHDVINYQEILHSAKLILDTRNAIPNTKEIFKKSCQGLGFNHCPYFLKHLSPHLVALLVTTERVVDSR